EARRGGVDAEDDPEELDIRARSPRVAIRPAPAHIRGFRPGREAELDILAPCIQTVDIPVPEPGLRQRLVHVESEVDRGGREIIVASYPLRERARFLPFGRAGQDRQRVRVLRK